MFTFYVLSGFTIPLNNFEIPIGGMIVLYPIIIAVLKKSWDFAKSR